MSTTLLHLGLVKVILIKGKRRMSNQALSFYVTE